MTPETVAISQKLLDKLFEDVKAKAFQEGRDTAHAIRLDDSSYGAVHSSLVVLDFKGFLDLRRQIRERRWYRGGDNPGQAYKGGCELIAIHHGDFCKQAIVIVSTAYDI